MAQNLKPIEKAFATREGKKRKIEHADVGRDEDTISLGSELNKLEAMFMDPLLPDPLHQMIIETVDKYFEDQYDPEKEHMDYDYQVEHNSAIDLSVIPLSSLNETNDSLSAINLRDSSSHRNVIAVPLYLKEVLDNSPFACLECKDQNCGTGADWILDSGASTHFTAEISDFASYEPLSPDEPFTIKTASKSETVENVGKGTVFIRHAVEENGRVLARTTRIYPVFHLPDVSTWLLSMGQFLKKNRVVGDTEGIHIVTPDGNMVLS